MLKKKSIKKNTKNKKSKKHGHTWWHHLLDKKLGDWLREKNTECAMCHGSGYMVVSHILPKGKYQGLRYDPVNILPMHHNCHEFKWHSNPIESRDWFMTNYPERWTYLQEAKQIVIKRDEKYYMKIKQALVNRNVEDLLILKK
jgi:hypothetical protein